MYCKICKMVIENVRQHVQIYHNPNESCNLCGKEYKTKYELKMHEEIQHSGKMYTCEITGCGRNFKSRNGLISHNLTSHQKDTAGFKMKYFCSDCGGKKFMYKNTYEDHLRVMHDAPKLSCKDCSMEFTYQSNLVRHSKSSCLPEKENSKLFVCSLCPKRFAKARYVKAHIRNTHNVSEQVHTCAYCALSFKNLDAVRYHKRNCLLKH